DGAHPGAELHDGARDRPVEARGDQLVEAPVHGAQVRLALPGQPVGLDLDVVLPDRQRIARVHWVLLKGTDRLAQVSQWAQENSARQGFVIAIDSNLPRAERHYSPRMRLPRTLPLLLLAMASLRAEAPPVKGTMPEDYLQGLGPLLKTAVERSPNTILANISVAQQEAQRYVYAASLWPQLSGNANYSIIDESVTGALASTQKGVFYNFNLNQPVFQWGALKNNAAIGELGVKIARRQFAEAYRQLAVEIRRQYMYLVGKQIALRNARFRQRIAEDGLKTDQAKFDSGSASQAELQGYKLGLEQAQLDTDRAAEDFAYSKRVLTRLVGVDDLPDDSVPLEIGHPEYSAALADAVLAGFVGDGVESSFQSQVYALQMKQQDLNYQIAKVRLLPKLNFAASYLLEDNTQAFSGFVSQVAVRE